MLIMSVFKQISFDFFFATLLHCRPSQAPAAPVKSNMEQRKWERRVTMCYFKAQSHLHCSSQQFKSSEAFVLYILDSLSATPYCFSPLWCMQIKFLCGVSSDFMRHDF